MDKEAAELNDMAAKIRKQAEDYAKTPEGEELGLRMEFATDLLKAIKAKKMTQADFCRKIGMKTPQFARIIQGNENITLAMVSRLARGLGAQPQIRFKRLPKAEAVAE